MRNMMLQAVEVSFPPMAEPVFKTPEEAIAFSVSIDRALRHPRISECIGQKIRSAWWRDDAIFLCLENEMTLHFGYAERAVDLMIEESVSSNVVGESQSLEITLIFLSGQESRWERNKLIKALEGNSVYRIQAIQSGYFLYVTDVDILWITYIINRATRRPFLYWDSVD